MTTLEATPTPVRTLDPLRAAVRYIDAHQERWNQAAWGIVDISSEARAALPQGVNLSLADLPIGVAGGTPADLSEPQACGTAYCVAGFVCHQAGWEEIWEVHPYDDQVRLEGVRKPGANINRSPFWPGDAAVAILGLSDNLEADGILQRMFGASNNRADIQAWAEELGELVGDPWDVPLPEWAAGQTPDSYNDHVSCDCGCEDYDDGYYEDEED